MLVLGPNVAESRHPDFEELGFRHTGYSLEFAFGSGSFLVPVYRSASLWQDGRVLVRDLHVLLEADAWPFEFDCRRFQVRESPAGDFVQFGAFMHGLFTELSPSATFREVLEELLSRFRMPLPEALPPSHGIELCRPLWERSYRIGHVHQSGTILRAEIVCMLNLSDGTEFPILAADAEFKPKHGQLGEGKWLDFNLESVERLAWIEFGKQFEGTPKAALGDSRQVAALLAEFQWANFTLLPASELADTRRKLIEQCPPSMGDNEVAELLQERRLYSPNTSLSQIRRQVEKVRRNA